MRELTKQQKNIIELLQKVCPSKVIAKKLYIEVTTVYWHLAFIRKKFNVHIKIEIINKLLDNSKVDISPIKLTLRGKDVFDLAMLGLNINEISHQLGIRHSGVLRHREKMLLENNCTSMLELIIKYHNTNV